MNEHLYYVNSLNGLTILASITLAFVQFAYKGHKQLIIEISTILLRLENFKLPVTGEFIVNELEKERDNIKNEAKTRNTNTMFYIYTIVLILLILSCISLHILILLEYSPIIIKHLTLYIFILLAILYLSLPKWFITINKEEKRIEDIKRFIEHMETIVEGYRSAEVFKSSQRMEV